MQQQLQSNGNFSACFCMGPQNGQPLCPCQMRGLIQRNGRWIRPEQDLGPVQPVIPVRTDWRAELDEPCMFDQLRPEDRSKPMGLACPCPRCSPRCGVASS